MSTECSMQLNPVSAPPIPSTIPAPPFTSRSPPFSILPALISYPVSPSAVTWSIPPSVTLQQPASNLPCISRYLASTCSTKYLLSIRHSASTRREVFDVQCMQVPPPLMGLCSQWPCSRNFHSVASRCRGNEYLGWEFDNMKGTKSRGLKIPG